MKKTFCFLVASAILGLNNINAQDMKTSKWRKTEADSMEKAQTYFIEKNYTMAYPMLEKIQANHPKELYLKYVLGVSSLYRSDKHKQALQLLSEVFEKDKKAADIELDLARAFHLNYQFDEAVKHIEHFSSQKKVSADLKKEGQHLKEYCLNAKEFTAKPTGAKITNISSPVNTENAEYVPVISSDEGVMIYTYRGEGSTGGLQNDVNVPDPLGMYYEDVFITYKKNGSWTKPKSIGSNINTVEHDAAIALSNDGQKLFLYRDDRTNGGGVFVSRLQGTEYSTPEPVAGYINTRHWEGSASMSADEKTIYFSSDRPGGKGGKDIYKATLMSDSTWGNVMNMGPAVNTPYDDDAPFIHPDGQTLIFSSKGHNSMGGYDIFRVDLMGNDTLNLKPINLGYPINTPDDDIYFVLNADGSKGYYSSGKEGGAGLQDIYLVEPGLADKKPVLLLVKGIVTLDDKPVEADIAVQIMNDGKNYNNLKSSAVDGSYLVNLPVGKDYNLVFRLKDFPDQKQIVPASDIKVFTKKEINIKFVTPKDTTPVAVLPSPVETAKVPVKEEPKINLSSNASREEIAAAVGNSKLEGLEYKVQIAAYRMPEHYNYNRLSGLGKVEKLALEDGITRFTIGGSFKTLNEAISHNQKVIAAGQSDAFVTAIYKGKRVYLHELPALLKK